jgi:hypothetical protein
MVSEVDEMRSFLLLVLALCAALASGCGPSPSSVPTPTDLPAPPAIPTDDPDRHYEPAGGFSYVPPEGWEIAQPASETAYKVARSQSGEGFSANLTMVDEAFTGSLEEYVSLSLDNMSEFFEGMQVLSRDPFETDEASSGIRIATQNVQTGLELNQIFYFFDLGTKKLVVTCTRLAESSEEVDAACDASVRTFRFEGDESSP